MLLQCEPFQIQLNYLCEHFMTKYCHPLGMSETMNIKQITGGSTGVVVVIIPNPVIPSVGLSSTCGSLLLHKGTFPLSNGRPSGSPAARKPLHKGTVSQARKYSSSSSEDSSDQYILPRQQILIQDFTGEGHLWSLSQSNSPFFFQFFQAY